MHKTTTKNNRRHTQGNLAQPKEQNKSPEPTLKKHIYELLDNSE